MEQWCAAKEETISHLSRQLETVRGRDRELTSNLSSTLE